MATITEEEVREQAGRRVITGFFKTRGMSQALQKSNAYKKGGIAVTTILSYLVQLVFTNKSMYMNILNGTHTAEFGKDVVYRLLNATYINWSTLLLNLASAVVTGMAALTGEKRLNAIAIDDSMYERLRSKKVELLANVYDHAAKGKARFKRGFRMLTMAWTDGVSLIPLLFRHMSSAEQKNRYQEINPAIDKRSVGYKARLQAISNTTQVVLDFLKRIKQMRIPAKHVLFDSWFSFPATMMRIHEIGFEVVGRLKDTPNIKYLVNGEKKTLRQIYAANRKRPGKARFLLSVPVLLYNAESETLAARIVFVRDRNNHSKWIAFGTTDMTLSEEEVIQLYGKRWDIEVFFKICKSHLNLAREFQGLSYDSITAHTTVVMIRYIILATQKRQNEDPRSLGELFHLIYDEVADIRFEDALSMVLRLLHDTLAECLFLTKAQMDEIISAFVDKLSGYFKRIFLPCNSPASAIAFP